MRPEPLSHGPRAVAAPAARRSRHAATLVAVAVLATVVTAPARPTLPRVALASRAGGYAEPPRASSPARATLAPNGMSRDTPGSSAEAAADARLVLLRTCAPAVDPTTLLAVIAVESDGDPLAVNINRGPRVRPTTVEAAVGIAEAAIAAGYSVDLGLMQVNSRNLDLLGTTVARMFDPCANVRAGAALLMDAYAAAARAYGEGQPALRAALSAYNTGDFSRGFANGYVARYYRDGAGAPPVGDVWHADVPPAADAEPHGPLPSPPNAYAASPTVYTRSRWDGSVGRTMPAPLTPDSATR